MQYRSAGETTDEQRWQALVRTNGVRPATRQPQTMATFVASAAAGSRRAAECDAATQPGFAAAKGGRKRSWSTGGSPLPMEALEEDAALYTALTPDATTLVAGDPEASRDEGRHHTLRMGRDAYVSNFHFDLLDNWVLAAKGRKRAVLVHPRWHECLRTEAAQESVYFRQSPLPVREAREWLAAHCPADDFGTPVAHQHVFEEGDLLFIPAWWLHAIETAPAEDSGWWISLNRFHVAGLPTHATDDARLATS